MSMIDVRERRAEALEAASRVMAGWLVEGSARLDPDAVIRLTLKVAENFDSYINSGSVLPVRRS